MTSRFSFWPRCAQIRAETGTLISIEAVGTDAEMGTVFRDAAAIACFAETGTPQNWVRNWGSNRPNWCSAETGTLKLGSAAELGTQAIDKPTRGREFVPVSAGITQV